MTPSHSKETFLLTGGGRIRCLRCTATSTRTKQQCGRPALKTSRTQKCQFHGGRGNSGPRTDEGRKKIAASHLVHGRATKLARQEHSRSSARLNRLEDALYILGMTSAPRTRGRKPAGYVAITSVGDIKQMILETELHRVRGVSRTL